MCLIIATPQGVFPPNDLLERAIQRNSDGWGLAFIRDGQLEARYGWTGKDMLAAVDEARGLPCIWHARWGTSGKNNNRNLHPFRVASPTHPGNVAYMAHNGILSIARPHHKLSDTAHLALWLEEHQFHTDWLIAPGWIKVMEEFCGPGNKIVFLSLDHGITFLNEKQGRWHAAGGDEKAWWLSNENSSCDYVSDLHAGQVHDWSGFREYTGFGGRGSGQHGHRYPGSGFAVAVRTGKNDAENGVAGMVKCDWCRLWKKPAETTLVTKHGYKYSDSDSSVEVCTRSCLENAARHWPGHYSLIREHRVMERRAIAAPAETLTDGLDQCELCQTWYGLTVLEKYEDCLLCPGCMTYMRAEDAAPAEEGTVALDGIRELI